MTRIDETIKITPEIWAKVLASKPTPFMVAIMGDPHQKAVQRANARSWGVDPSPWCRGSSIDGVSLSIRFGPRRSVSISTYQVPNWSKP